MKKHHTALVLLCVSTPAFMLQLDFNIVSVSLPTIARSLHASFAGIEWVITAYMLSFASLLLPAGALADRFGRKRLLIIGLSVFSLASILSGSAQSLPFLLAARAVQGAGAAMQLSASLAALSHAFDGKARAHAFSSWGAVVGIGMACGPVVGGLVTQSLGWGWAFYVNPPIGCALIILTSRVLEPSRDPDATRLDLQGVALFCGALFLTTLALIEGNHRGWTDSLILGEFIGAVVLLAFFVAVEQRQERPMLDLSFFWIPTFVGASLAQFSFSAGMLTMLIFVPSFLQGGLGNSSGIAGVMMLPMVTPLFLVPRIASRHLARRFSGRTILTGGLVLVCVGLLLFAVVVGCHAYIPLIGGMILVGVGGGLLNGETTKVGMTVIPRERSGMASGVAGTVRFTGLVIGIAALGVALYSGVASAVTKALPQSNTIDRQALVHAITAGHLSAAMLPANDLTAMKAVAVESLVSGYQRLFIAAAVFVAVSAGITWLLVSANETPPCEQGNSD